MGRVWFDFTTQLANIDVQVMRLGTIACAPYLREQHLASHNFTTVLDESLEQIIFGRSQLDLLSIYLHEALGKINFEWPGSKSRLSSSLYLGRMTQCDSYARQHFIHTEGLGYVVVGTQVKRLHFVAFGVLNRKHNHGQTRL